MTAWVAFWEGVNVVQLVAWVVGIVAVVTFVFKGWPVLRKFVRTIDVVIQLSDVLPRLQADVSMIKHEVLPNGGGSLKDQATRTEGTLDELAVQVAHVRRQQAATKTTLARTERTLTDHIATTKE